MKSRSKQAQGRQLIAMLKRKSMTYREMLASIPSYTPWKRVMECLRDDEQLLKGKDSRGLIRWRVIAATKWTA